MTTKSLFLALSLAAAPLAAQADPNEEVDCSQQAPSETKTDIIAQLKKIKKSDKHGCANVDFSSVTLVGGLVARPCNDDANCEDGKHFTQEFKGKDFSGHANVDWHFTRAGFTEWCTTDLNDCSRK